jgi:hypothetical protein
MNFTLRDLPTELRKGKVRLEAALNGLSDLGKAAAFYTTAAFLHRGRHLEQLSKRTAEFAASRTRDGMHCARSPENPVGSR